jgi:hypothetical protein
MQPRDSHLTQGYLRSILNYEESTGLFTWAKQPTKCKPAGSNATISTGSHPNRYLAVMIEGESYLAHRLAWVYVTGEQPKDLIGHIDGDRTNNRFNNLIERTNSERAKLAPKTYEHRVAR